MGLDMFNVNKERSVTRCSSAG